MSAEPGRIQKHVFNTAMFTYTLGILVYASLLVLEASSLGSLPFNEDQFVANMDLVAWATLGTALFAIMLSLGLERMNVGTLGDILFASPKRRIELSHVPFLRSFWGVHLCLVFLLTLTVSVQVTQASLLELLDPDGLAGAARLWSGLTQPNMSLLGRAIVEAVETVFIAFLATVLAIPVAFILAFFAARNLMTGPFARTTYAVIRLLLNISRSVEPLIWALIFTVWVGVGPFAGMLALFVHSVAGLTKFYSEIIEGVSEGPIDGIRATGASPLQVIWFAVVPQVVLPYVAMTVYRWDTNVRMATVIGLVGGGGIGTLLITYQGQAMWPEVGCILIVIAAIVWLMDTASAFIREALK